MNSIEQNYRLRWRTGLPLLNWTGRKLNRKRLLDADWLMNQAELKTGLKNWGRPSVRNPLAAIVGSYEKSGLLTPIGRRMLRRTMMWFLVKRLRIEELLTEKPDILKEEIHHPVFIVGLPRSGTTLLYNLLAMDPAFRPLKIWETNDPVSGEEPGPITRRFDNFLRNWLFPGMDAIHPMSPLDIEECTMMQMNSFYVPGAFSLFGETADYETWLTQQSGSIWREAYEKYKQQLQILQHRQPGLNSHWLLKSPAHVPNLEYLIEHFPDAKIIMPIREMEEVFPSMVSMFATTRTLFNYPVWKQETLESSLDLACQFQDAIPSIISKYPDSIMPIEFTGFINDQAGTIMNIYKWLGFGSPVGLEGRVKEYRRMDKHIKGKHKYRLEQFGLEQADIDKYRDREAWERLCEMAKKNQ